jgi:hypothetical protein
VLLVVVVDVDVEVVAEAVGVVGAAEVVVDAKVVEAKCICCQSKTVIRSIIRSKRKRCIVVKMSTMHERNAENNRRNLISN